MKLHRRLSLVCLLCSMIWVSGCLRPSETNIYVVTAPGQPLQVLEAGGQEKGADYIVKGKDLKSGKVIEKQKINGWVVMPPDHWSIVKAKLNGVAKFEADNKVFIPPVNDPPETKP